MINFTENEKLIIYHINKRSIDLDVDIKINKESVMCLDKNISNCNKQYLSNIWCSIHEKLSNFEAELKWCFALKKRVFIFCQDLYLLGFIIMCNVFWLLKTLDSLSEPLSFLVLVELIVQNIQKFSLIVLWIVVGIELLNSWPNEYGGFVKFLLSLSINQTFSFTC